MHGRSRARVALPLVAASLVALAAPGARAELEEWQLGLGVGYRALIVSGDPADVTLHAPGFAGGLWYGLSDYWQLGASLQLGPGFADGLDPALVGSAAAEVRYILDIVEWVPHLTAAVGILYDGAADAVGRHPADLVLGVGGGLDYRPARDWGLGLDFRYDFVVSDLAGFTAAFHAAFVYTSYFE